MAADSANYGSRDAPRWSAANVVAPRPHRGNPRGRRSCRSRRFLLGRLGAGSLIVRGVVSDGGGDSERAGLTRSPCQSRGSLGRCCGSPVTSQTREQRLT
ncbi:hypothetical protein NN561_019939 [Cricetulus griseus]